MTTKTSILWALLTISTNGVYGQDSSKRTVEAEEFIPRGPQGQELAKLGQMGTGAGLMLYDNQHLARVFLTTADGVGKRIVTFRSNGQVGASLGVGDNDNPFVALSDKSGKPIVVLDYHLRSARGPRGKLCTKHDALEQNGCNAGAVHAGSL